MEKQQKTLKIILMAHYLLKAIFFIIAGLFFTNRIVHPDFFTDEANSSAIIVESIIVLLFLISTIVLAFYHPEDVMRYKSLMSTDNKGLNVTYTSAFKGLFNSKYSARILYMFHQFSLMIIFVAVFLFVFTSDILSLREVQLSLLPLSIYYFFKYLMVSAIRLS